MVRGVAAIKDASGPRSTVRQTQKKSLTSHIDIDHLTQRHLMRSSGRGATAVCSMALSSKCSPAGHQLHLRVYTQASCRSRLLRHSNPMCNCIGNSRTTHPESDEVSDHEAQQHQSLAVPARSWVKANSPEATSAAVFALATLTSLTYEVLSHVDLSPVRPAAEALPKVLVISAAGIGAALSSAKLLLGDTFHIEWHR